MYADFNKTEVMYADFNKTEVIEKTKIFSVVVAPPPDDFPP